MNQKLLLLLAASMLGGCAATVNSPVASRTSNPEKFILLKTGKIDPAKVQAVSDCIHDGFAGSHGVFTNFTFRMNRRAAGYRIETTAGGAIVLVSADVMDDGTVELRESKDAGLINTKGERDAFAKCTESLLISNSL